MEHGVFIFSRSNVIIVKNNLLGMFDVIIIRLTLRIYWYWHLSHSEGISPSGVVMYEERMRPGPWFGKVFLFPAVPVV